MITKLVRLLETPKFWRAFSSAQPRSLASFRIVSQLRRLDVEFQTIIDGGANVGQFSRAAHSFFPQANIFAFEPLPDIAGQLKSNLADVSQLKIFNHALGDSDGEITFHRTSDSQSSSALPMTDSSKDGLLKGIRETEQLTVPIKSLDSALADESLSSPMLLKLDLQGFELTALKGATKTVLPQASHVLLEAVFDEAYEGEPLFDELWSFLQQQGFRFDRPLNFVTGGEGEIQQIDALFARQTSTK